MPARPRPPTARAFAMLCAMALAGLLAGCDRAPPDPALTAEPPPPPTGTIVVQ